MLDCSPPGLDGPKQEAINVELRQHFPFEVGLHLSCSFYHVGFVPKGRKKELYGKISKFLVPVFRELVTQRRSIIEEGHMDMVQDHVHMVIRIPPKYSVAEVIGCIKGKSAIAVARKFGGRKRNFNGETFWARGNAVSIEGFEKEQIRKYIANQEQLDGVGEWYCSNSK